MQLTTHATDFCSISAVLSTAGLRVEEKRLLPLLLVSLLECPQRRADGSVASSEEVIDFVYRHTTSCEFHLGLRSCAGFEVNRFCELAKLSVEVEAASAALGVQLLFGLLQRSFVTAERLLIATERTAKLLEEQVRDGDNVCGILTRRLTLGEASCYNCFDHVPPSPLCHLDPDETPPGGRRGAAARGERGDRRGARENQGEIGHFGPLRVGL